VRTGTRSFRCLLVMAAIILAAGCSSMHSPIHVNPRSGSIDGRIVNETGYRVQAARVSVDGAAIATESDWNGYFTLTDVTSRMSRVLWNLSEHDDGQRKDGRHGTELRWVEPENRQQGCMA
jgi:hypothetical protein